ncbi:MAG: hydroxyphenylacetyl-CoA thioesterase PaaI [Pseudomonadota bacterium]|nr:hydroxyphenylacetyl-CoA thioesterase PaaI [Pseudomonadota bacterium]
MSEMNPQTLAEECARAMFARDRASQRLGMNIESVAPGQAIITMIVTGDMIQGHGSCHGGYLFTLADSAFAYAANSYNRTTVASGCSIDYMYGAKEGDRLTATAEERARGGRTGIYDITLTNQDGRKVALFRGRSYEVRGTVRNSEKIA